MPEESLMTRREAELDRIRLVLAASLYQRLNDGDSLELIDMDATTVTDSDGELLFRLRVSFTDGSHIDIESEELPQILIEKVVSMWLGDRAAQGGG